MRTLSESIYSAEIKTEVLNICDAFYLGNLIRLVSFTPSETLPDYILTEFETEQGIFEHFYRIKNN